MDYAELGRRIRQAREEAVLPQEVVAQHLGLSRSAVSLIESGKRKIDSLELRAFSQLVGRSPSFFLEDASPAVKAADLGADLPTQVLFSANQVVDISQDRDQIERFKRFHHDFATLARMLNRLREPYATEPRYNIFKPTPAAARWMAAQERARLGLSVSSPVRDIQGILESEGVKVLAWPLATPKLGGCFIFSRLLGSFVLVKRNLKSSSTGMINFVLAHEYCHHLIHRQQQGITCDPAGNYRKPEEYFAQWFAANFLMPEEALVPRLMFYLEISEGTITAEVVMRLAVDFGVSYTAMLNRLADKNVGLIDQAARRQLAKEKPSILSKRIGQSIPQVQIGIFPEEYVEMVWEAYKFGHISLSKVAELLDISLEAAQALLEEREVPIEIGVSSESELLRDIINA